MSMGVIFKPEGGAAMREAQPNVALIVEDDATLRGVVRRVLEDTLPGAAVMEAADTAAAFGVLSEVRPGLVVLDHFLPDGEGLAVLEWVREQAPEVPVIYLTAVNNAVVAVAALKQGASDYVVKSADLAANLTRAVSAALEQRRLRQEEQAQLDWLRDQALRDPLTGLWNRRALDDHRVTALLGSGPLAVSMIDLDGFKSVNDTFGHGVGDQTLREVAELLRECMRDSDLLVRYGGDEFVAVLPGLTHAAVPQWVERVRESLARACASGRLPFLLGASIGVTVGQAALTELIRRADAAMYEEKSRRRELRGAQR